MNDKIDLSENPDVPVGPTPQPYYPTVSMSHPDLVNLPNSGRSVIEHEVVRREHSKEDGKHAHRVTLKIKSIRPMGRKRASRTLAAESAMRDLMNQ